MIINYINTFKIISLAMNYTTYVELVFINMLN
jgi:hypothetical protein